MHVWQTFALPMHHIPFGFTEVVLPQLQDVSILPSRQLGTADSSKAPPALPPLLPDTIPPFRASAIAAASPGFSKTPPVLPPLVGSYHVDSAAPGKAIFNTGTARIDSRYTEALKAKESALRGRPLKAEEAISLQTDLVRTETSARSDSVRCAGTRRMMAKLLRSAEQAGLSVTPDVEKAVEKFCYATGFSDNNDTHHMFSVLEERSGKDGPEMAMKTELQVG